MRLWLGVLQHARAKADNSRSCVVGSPGPLVPEACRLWKMQLCNAPPALLLDGCLLFSLAMRRTTP